VSLDGKRRCKKEDFHIIKRKSANCFKCESENDSSLESAPLSDSNETSAGSSADEFV
jgi:hypothetical protein